MGVWEYGNGKMKHIYYYSHANYIIGIQNLSNTIDKCTQFSHIFEIYYAEILPYSHTPILPYFPVNPVALLHPKLSL
jgi:hypothetical protein